MNEIRILLACNAGMSTSMLIKKMNEAAVAKNIKVTVCAFPAEEVKSRYRDFDVILLGPQIKYLLRGVRKDVHGEVPVDAIDMSAYGLMNGAKVLDQAIALIQKKS